MANYSGYILIKKGWGYNWGSTWSGAVLPERLAGYGARRNDRIYVRPSWDFWWDQNWGGNTDHFTNWNVEWGKNWGGSLSENFVTNLKKGFYPHENSWGCDWGYSWGGGLRLSGSYSNNRPIAMRQFNHTGHWGHGYVDVFYDRILIEPVSLDFGTVLSTQVLTFLVWNAFLVSKQLDNVNEIDLDEGTTFSGDTFPRVYAPLEEEQYSVEVTTTGPPTIDASLVFDWESPIADITVTITGTRVILLPVTFRAGVKEYLVWKTEVLTSYNGSEQRIKVRRMPRQQLAIKAYLDRNEMHRVENLLYGWRKRTWSVPMWIEARQVDSAVTSGDFTINVDTQWGDFRVTRLAVIWESPRKFDVFQIESFTTSTITANRGINDDYSANAIVMPVRACRMLRDPVRSTSGYDAVLETVVEVTDNVILPTFASSVQWNSEDTYFVEPLATSDDGVDDSYQHRIQIMDYGTGVVDWEAPWDNTKIKREFDLILEGLQDIWEHREWLHRRAGRLRPFYMPTFENNFQLLTEGNIADSFRAEPNNYSSQSTDRTTICFKMTDGTYEIRTVTAAIINVSDELEVSFTPNLDRNASEVDEINFFGLKRLSSDRIELEWRPNNVVITTVPTTEISP